MPRRIIETRAQTQDAAVLLASLLTYYLIHYGYPGRKATAGNIAYPLSPNLVSFRRDDGSFGAIMPSGTRDPVFFKKLRNDQGIGDQADPGHVPLMRWQTPR